MGAGIFRTIGQQLHAARKRRNLTQPQLAQRLGRDRARISEFERDMLIERAGRDRLTLFVEMCDAMDLVPVLVPRARARDIMVELGGASGTSADHGPVRSTFDDVFVDLDDDEAP